MYQTMNNGGNPNLSWRQPYISTVPLAVQPPNNYEQKWAAKAAKGIGITLMCMGVLSILFNVAWLIIDDNESLDVTGVGFWGGLLLFVTGLLSTLAGIKKSRGLIISTMVMSIITTVISPAIIGLGGTQTGISSSMSYQYRPDGGWNYYYNDRIGLPFGIAFILVGVASFGLLLTVSILTCRATCCCCNRERRYMMYSYAPNQMGNNYGATMMVSDGAGPMASMPPPYGMAYAPAPGYAAAGPAPGYAAVGPAGHNPAAEIKPQQ